METYYQGVNGEFHPMLWCKYDILHFYDFLMPKNVLIHFSVCETCSNNKYREFSHYSSSHDISEIPDLDETKRNHLASAAIHFCAGFCLHNNYCGLRILNVLSSLIKAECTLYKAFMVYNLQYSFEATSAWTFLQRNVF